MSTNLISREDLADRDTFRELEGDCVLEGSIDDLIADETEGASRVIYRQIGEGQDAYREDTGARARV